MFMMTQISDLVRIAPHDFNKESIHAIEDSINTKYANRLIKNIGLCISVRDILSASEGLIGNLDGYVYVQVEFNMIVFRPFKGEVIQARIASQSAEGMRLSTEFFEHIYVPHEFLPEGCEFIQTENAWVWHSDGEELYYDTNEIVRLKVVSEEWQNPPPAELAESTDELLEASQEIINQRPVWKIIGSMREAGLGCYIWWDE